MPPKSTAYGTLCRESGHLVKVTRVPPLNPLMTSFLAARAAKCSPRPITSLWQLPVDGSRVVHARFETADHCEPIYRSRESKCDGQSLPRNQKHVCWFHRFQKHAATRILAHKNSCSPCCDRCCPQQVVLRSP